MDAEMLEMLDHIHEILHTISIILAVGFFWLIFLKD